MLRLPNIESNTLQRLMSERIIALLDCHANKDGSMADGEEAGLFPEYVGLEQARYEFDSLRKLLQHEKAFTPELLGEYLMYSLIQIAIDTDDTDDTDEPCLHLASARFLEKERAELIEAFDSETVAEYEDLRNYDSTLFWDEDFLMLDEMTAEQLLANPVNDMMGIGPANGTVLELDGKRVAVTLRAWD